MSTYVHRITKVAQEVGLCVECPFLAGVYGDANELDTTPDVQPGEVVMSHALRFNLLVMGVKALKGYLDEHSCTGPIEEGSIPPAALTPEAIAYVQELREFVAAHPELAPKPSTSHTCPPDLQRSRVVQKAIFGDHIQIPDN